jgi:vitamin B12 transporter
MQTNFRNTISVLAILAASGATPALAQDLDIGEVVVTANKTPTEKSKVGSTVYVVTKKDIDKQSLPAATDYLAQTPGISIASQGGNGHITTFFMRGLPGEYVKTFVDGIDVSDVTYTKTQAQFGQFLAGDLDRIEVLQGSQGALYGADAIAGVVNVSTLGTPEKGLHQRIYGEGGSRGTFLGGYSLNSGFDRGNFGFNIVGLTTDGFSTAASGTEKDGYQNLSGTVGGRFDVSENLSLFANGLFIKSNTDFDDSFPPPDFVLGDSDAHSSYRQAAGRVGADFKLFDGRLSNTIALQYSNIDRTSVAGPTGFPPGTSTFNGTRTKIDYLGSIALTPTLTANFGADWERRHAETSSGIDNSVSMGGGWVEAVWTPVDPLTLTASVRQDEHSLYGGHTTWRATGSYNFADTGTRFHSSVGTGYRAPSLFELYDPGTGNAKLHPETSVSFDFGIEQHLLDDRLVTDLTFFMADINDYIGFGPPPIFPTIQTDGVVRTRGVEASLTYAPTSWLNFRGNYTYTDVTQPDGTRQVRIPRHAIGLSASVQPAEKWMVSAATRIALDTVDFGGSGKEPLDDYVLLDAKVSYKPTDATEIYVRGENLLNQKYEVSRGYGTPGLGVFAGFKATF